LLALGWFFYLVLTHRPPEEETPPAHGDETPAEPQAAGSPETSSPVRRTRWEFYLGGMAGLLLGYFLREANQSADAMLAFAPLTPAETIARALVAGGRSVLWFAVFALLEGVPWTRRSMALALAAGVAALLIHLSIASSISLPSVAQPL